MATAPSQQLAWYVAGPIMGLCVVACRVLLVGYGAKTAGGCTSGNGLTGTSVTWTRERAGRRHVVGSLLFGVVIGVLLFQRGGAVETEPPTDVPAEPAPALALVTPSG